VKLKSSIRDELIAGLMSSKLSPEVLVEMKAEEFSKEFLDKF